MDESAHRLKFGGGWKQARTLDLNERVIETEHSRSGRYGSAWTSRESIEDFDCVWLGFSGFEYHVSLTRWPTGVGDREEFRAQLGDFETLVDSRHLAFAWKEAERTARALGWDVRATVFTPLLRLRAHELDASLLQRLHRGSERAAPPTRPTGCLATTSEIKPWGVQVDVPPPGARRAKNWVGCGTVLALVVSVPVAGLGFWLLGGVGALAGLAVFLVLLCLIASRALRYASGRERILVREQGIRVERRSAVDLRTRTRNVAWEDVARIEREEQVGWGILTPPSTIVVLPREDEELRFGGSLLPSHRHYLRDLLVHAAATAPGAAEAVAQYAGAPSTIDVVLGAAQHCPFCREGVREATEPLMTCGGCRAVYHKQCLLEAGVCGTIGCRNSRRPKPG